VLRKKPPAPHVVFAWNVFGQGGSAGRELLNNLVLDVSFIGLLIVAIEPLVTAIEILSVAFS
jgi:hypothetical protein